MGFTSEPVHAIIRIMGNSQAWDKPNGFHLRRQEDFEAYRARHDVHVLECVTWDADMKEQCDKLFSYGVTHLHIVGHSHGVGRGAVALIKRIIKRNRQEVKLWQKRGRANGMPRPRQIQVVTLTGNDGVAYPELFGFIPIPPSKITKPLLVRALTRWPKIKLPAHSVQHLYGMRQSNRIPKGHEWEMGEQTFKPTIENIDEDGFKLVHHDADPAKRERDFDESKVSRALELQVFKQHIG